MNKTFRNVMMILVVALILFIVAGCGDTGTVSTKATTEKATEKTTAATKETTSSTTAQVGEPTSPTSSNPDKQLEAPQKGEEIAAMETTLGTIYIRFFPEDAPKAVENFKTHAKNGYFNGLIFHRVMQDFMIQGGDPTGTGRGGESIWGSDFEDEFTLNLFNYRGALSMANSGANTNGSQFFIVQAPIVDPGMLAQMPDGGWPQAAVDNYTKLGGTPWLDQKHTVFGMVFDGMDIVDAIAAVKTNENDKPLEDVLIKNVTISQWE